MAESKVVKEENPGALRVEYGTWKSDTLGINTLRTNFNRMINVQMSSSGGLTFILLINDFPFNGNTIEYLVEAVAAGDPPVPTSGIYQIEGF